MRRWRGQRAEDGASRPVRRRKAPSRSRSRRRAAAAAAS